MESMTRRLFSPWILWPLLGATLIGLLQTGIEWSTVRTHNQLLSATESIEVQPDSDPLLIYAKAYQLQQTGDPLEALRLYGMIHNRGDAAFQARVRYNLGTLYLRDAAKLWKERGLLEHIRVNTLLDATKDNLRQSLTLDPTRWDARYHLEYAYRITPPPKERPKNDFQGSKGSVFATLPTIPGGGP